MRKALVSLIAAGAAVTVSAAAFAQDAAVVAPPPTLPAAEAVPATPTDVPTPAPAVDPAPAAEVPAPVPAPAVAVEVPAAPVVVAPPPPPPAPTDPATIRVLDTLERVCMPLVRGGDLQALAKPIGFKKKRDAFTMSLARPATVTVLPTGTNKNVCMMEIDTAIRGDEALTVGIHNWAMARGYTLYRNDEYTTDLKRHTRSWELTTPEGGTEALVLITSWKPDGSSMSRNADRSTLMYSVQ
jgi:hypothetical protein